MIENKIKVIISKEAYERIVIYANRYANKEMPQKAWREVYGILIGKLKESFIFVENAIPIVVGDAAGVTYENREYADTALIDENIYEKAMRSDEKTFFVGWWHTHPGFGFFFSDTDKMTHLGYQQANPYAIGLIYDHTKHNYFDSGIDILQLECDPALGKLNLMSPYCFIDYEIEDNDDIIAEMNEKLNKIIEELDNFVYEFNEFDEKVKKKKFAQLQRNYGLLMVKKTKDELDNRELDEDEKYLYEWNEEYIKKTYRIPKFRQKIENKIKKISKINNIKKKESLKQKLQNDLLKPLEKLQEIKRDFTKLNNRADRFIKYLDSRERKFFEHFSARIKEYKDILKNLIDKIEKI